MKSKKDQLGKYLEGYERPEPPQAPPGSDGDPQIAALTAYIQTKTDIASHSIILDFGSGEGVLPHWLNKIWPQDRRIPSYHAVDIDDSLDKLRLPIRVHNNSRKVRLEEFYEGYFETTESQIELVVVRNVLHEMGLRDTARLFSCLTSKLKPGTELYVQDMINLPRVEPGRAGWDPELLSQLFQNLGASSERIALTSHRGTGWFALRVRTGPAQISFERCLQLCAQARKSQRDRLLAQVKRLNLENQPDTGILRVVLQNDVTTISLQLETEVESDGKPASPPIEASSLSSEGLLLRVSEAGPLDYAVRATGDAARVGGLLALLSNKRMLDIASIVAMSKRFVSFAGYSQHSFFEDPRMPRVIEDLLSEGKRIRLLLVDPTSFSASARALVPAYSDPEDLLTAIRMTISAATEYREALVKRFDMQKVSQCFAVALTPWTPPCSYFIVDDTCVASLYSAHLTGSTGSCFVFRAGESATNSYYRVLLDDFEATWNSPTTTRLL